MRQILCMSHGPLAKGMIETLSIIVGDLDNIDFDVPMSMEIMT